MPRFSLAHPGPTSLWIALGASFALSLFPFGEYFLYPFRIFTTWAHECGHALTATLLGAHVRSISIFTDTSGLTEFTIAPGRLRESVIASAGYLSASLMGCFLLASTRLRISTTAVLYGVGALIFLSLVLWVRSFFGIVSVAIVGAALLYLGTAKASPWSVLALQFLAVQTALNAIFDIRTLFMLSARRQSDAETMHRLLLLPSWVWAGAWMGMSLAMLFFTWKWTEKR
jgi:hypothetical protein